jgi:regulator of replication initiation timing
MAATEISMELIYSTQSSGFDPDKRYRNPEHFDRPEAGVTGVVVVGEWPKVVEAYERADVEVTSIEAESRQVLVVETGDNTAELEALVGKLRIESDTVRAVIDGIDAGEIEKPEAGELAIRLFQALDGIRVQMVELSGARDNLAAENETLRNELAELKAGEGVEVEAMKAKLDAADVPYRANASKESLEKLVADLPRA